MSVPSRVPSCLALTILAGLRALANATAPSPAPHLNQPRLPLSTLQVEALTVEGVYRGMADYSLSIPAAVPSRDMAMAEFEWRNGWFLAQRRTPAHVAWLRQAGVER